MNDFIDTAAEKAKIRLRMAEMRSALSAAETKAAGEQIMQRILSLPELAASCSETAVIGLYSPIRNEVDLLSHAALLRARGLLTALPRVCGGSLVFGMAVNGENYCPGVFGIMEPLPGAKEVACQDFYAICLPGLAFDRTGARLGYGKGYYDRFLQSVPGVLRPVLIGVGYDLQLLASIPQDGYDQRLDYIITPSETVAVRSSGSFDR